jgi:hypothetical protein
MSSSVDPITGDDLTALFHGTSKNGQDSISSLGLVPDDGLSDEGMLGCHEDGSPITKAVFLSTEPDDAATYGDLLYRVDITGLDYVVVDGPDGWHYAVLETITPDRLRLVHS